MDRVLNEFLHFRADRPELGNSKIDQRRFEGRELSAAKMAKDLRFAHALQRGVNADQVVSLGSRRQSLLLAWQGFWIRLRLADLLRDGIGKIGRASCRERV